MEGTPTKTGGFYCDSDLFCAQSGMPAPAVGNECRDSLNRSHQLDGLDMEVGPR